MTARRRKQEAIQIQIQNRLRPFQVLGLAPTASFADIKQALRVLSREIQLSGGPGVNESLKRLSQAAAEAVALKTASM